MAAIEAFRQTHNRGERPHDAAVAPPQLAEALVRALRGGLPVIACDERDDLDFLRIESAEVAVLDQVVRVFVVQLVADEGAGVVQNRRVFQPLALAIRQAVNRARLIEELRRQPRHLLRVLRPVMAALGELVHAAPADVRKAIGLRDLFAVTRDVIEHDALAQGQIAERDVVGAKTPQQLVEQHDAGDRKIRAPRLQARHAQPIVEIERDQVLANAPDLFRGRPPVA
jgi:hypothetical protein